MWACAEFYRLRASATVPLMLGFRARPFSDPQSRATLPRVWPSAMACADPNRELEKGMKSGGKG